MAKEKQTSLNEDEENEQNESGVVVAEAEAENEGKPEEDEEEDEENKLDDPADDPDRFESNGDPHQSGPRQKGVGDHDMKTSRRQAHDTDET